MNKKPLRIIANPPLFYGATIYVAFCFLLCLCMAFFIITPEESKDASLIRGFFVFLGIAMIGAGFLCMPRWLQIITFEKDCVKFKPAFGKEITKQYSNYFIYLAHYSHVGLSVNFIVFSQRKLNKSELENINKIKSDEQIIKVKYSKKTYQKIQQALPEKQKKELNKALGKQILDK